MKDSFQKFAGVSGIIVGALSILYAVFYLVISKSPDDTGRLVSWIILGVSGIITSAVYVGLYQRLRDTSEGYSLWAMLLGLAQSIFTLTNGVSQALLISGVQSGDISRDAFNAALRIPPAVEPRGLWAFAVFALVSLVFGRLILSSRALPRALGYVALFNSILLILLFAGNIIGSLPLILASGGLSSVIVTPLWWIWTGMQLRQEPAVMRARPAPAE